MRYSNIAVFDIGGTWFRSGIYTKNSGLTHLSKVPAYNYINTPHDKAIELQLKLVDYLIEQVLQFQKESIDIQGAAISMGAALNGHTGEILNSGPLWGPDCEPFDLINHLKQRMPEINWLVINDVSAALLRHTNEPEYVQAKCINLITVSSGIACRTFDNKSKYIPLNENGIQGEIGHIPIHFSLFGQTITENCDCGGVKHLNAFASGRGISKILHSFTTSKATPIKDSELIERLHSLKTEDLNKEFFKFLNEDNADAIEILDQVTYPIAEMIIYTLTIDAEVERIIMTGGVVHAAEQQYMDSLLRNLEKIGLYQIPNQAAFFEKTVKLGINDDNSGLVGAAIAYGNETA